MTARPTLVPDASRTAQPHYELLQESDGWLWRLHNGEETIIAESADRFPSREIARKAIDDLAVSAPTAGTAVTRRVEA